MCMEDYVLRVRLDGPSIVAATPLGLPDAPSPSACSKTRQYEYIVREPGFYTMEVKVVWYRPDSPAEAVYVEGHNEHQFNWDWICMQAAHLPGSPFNGVCACALRDGCKLRADCGSLLWHLGFERAAHRCGACVRELPTWGDKYVPPLSAHDRWSCDLHICIGLPPYAAHADTQCTSTSLRQRHRPRGARIQAPRTTCQSAAVRGRCWSTGPLTRAAGSSLVWERQTRKGVLRKGTTRGATGP